MRNHSLRRRDFLMLSAGAATTAFAWPTPAKAQKKGISIWTPIAAQAATRRAYTILKERYERKYSDLSAEVVSVGWSPLRDKVFAAVRSGQGPSIVDFQTEQMPSYAALGGFAAVDDLFRASGLKAQMWDIATDYSTWMGKMYSVPWGLDVAMGALYYRQDMLEKVGIKRPPQTLQELVDAAKELTRDTNGDGKPDQWGIAFSGVPGDAFHGGFVDVFYSHGGKVFDDRSGPLKIGLDSAAGRAALQFMVDLMHKHKAAHPDSASFNSDQMRDALIKGKVAMVGSGSRHWASSFVPLAQDLIKQGVLRVAPWPAGPGGRRLKLLSMGYQITAFKDTNRDAAWKFAMTALEPDTLHEVAMASGFPPFIKGIWSRPVYQELEVLRVLREIVEKYAAPFDSHPLQVPIARGLAERMVSKALSGEVTVERAIREAQDQAVLMLNEYEKNRK